MKECFDLQAQQTAPPVWQSCLRLLGFWSQTLASSCLAPVLFLFNGGEETLMQAAHGFVSSGHRWVDDIRAFINLEATGSGGPDTLFQHTGGWTAETYAAAAKYPRGSVFLQVCNPICYFDFVYSS